MNSIGQRKIQKSDEPEGETISEVKDKKGKGSGTKDDVIIR